MLRRFALTAFVIIALAVSVFTIEQPRQQRRDVATTQINSTQDHGDALYALPASSMNTSDARNTIFEDFGHLQDLVTRRSTPDRTITLRVTLTKPPRYTQYLGRVKVGDRIYSLAFATASFNMWVDSTVRPQNTDPDHWVGAIGDNTRAGIFDYVFGGRVQGWLHRNTVELDELPIPDIPFGSTTKGWSKEAGHGVIPFPFQEYRTLKHHPFWMRAQTMLERKVIAFSHRLTLGEVHIGMIENVYVGGIEYHPCARSFFWMTEHAKIRVNSRSLGLEDETIIFDTASQYIRGPPDAVDNIYKSIPGSQKLKDGLYGYPCDITPPKITVQLRNGGREWLIEPYLFSRWGTRPNPAHPFYPDHPQHGAYDKFHTDPVHPIQPDHSELCIGLFAAHTEYTVVIQPAQSRLSKPVLEYKFWVMGHPFLVGKYLVLDWDTRQIGVAELPPIIPNFLHHTSSAPHGHV